MYIYIYTLYEYVYYVPPIFPAWLASKERSRTPGPTGRASEKFGGVHKWELPSGYLT